MVKESLLPFNFLPSISSGCPKLSAGYSPAQVMEWSIFSCSSAGVQDNTRTAPPTVQRKQTGVCYKVAHDIIAAIRFVCVVYPMTSFSQQDCQEFLAMLLDTLHEDCVLQSNDGLMTELSELSHNQPISTRDDTRKDSNTEHGSVITQTFRGMLKNEASSLKKTVVP